MKNIDELLNSLREHGTIDSEGQFTVSLKEARRKLTQYHSSDKALYLLFLISDAIATGASSISIRGSETRYELQFQDAYIPELDLLAAFEGKSLESSDMDMGDLVLGLQGAFASKAFQLELRVQSTSKPCYLWTMGAQGAESQTQSRSTKNSVELKIEFRQNLMSQMIGVLKRLGGYGGMPPEAKLVDQYCDRSLIPIVLNGNPVERPLLLPEASIYATVGDLGHKSPKFKRNLVCQDVPWKGALALTPGRIQIVIRGVAYCQLDESGLSGTIYHDHLNRDVSRERVVRDVEYQSLLEQLEDIRVRLYEALALELPTVTNKSYDHHRTELVYLFLVNKLSYKAQQAVWSWMLASLADKATHFQPSPSGLLALYSLLEERVDPKLTILKKLLEYCSENISEPEDGFSKVLERTYRFFKQRDPEQTLVLGYLLLGVGAVHQIQGRKKAGEKAWFQSLEVVWGGKDDKAQELIYMHMGHKVPHILSQVALALKMYLEDLTADP